MTGWIGLDRGRARMRRLVTGLAVASLGLAASAGAQEAHFDVLLFDDGAGNLRAGAIDVDALAPELDNVVIEGELFGDTILGAPPTFQGADPGFFSVSDANAGVLGGSNTNLPGGATVTVDFLVEPTLNISLAYWNGSSFGSTPGGETLAISKGATAYGALGGSSSVLGVEIGTTSAGGFLDDHPDFDLGAGATGVYLAYGRANVAGLTGPSNPFWIVFGTLDLCEETASCSALQEQFNFEIEEQIEAAIGYVNANLVPIPEPSTALLMALGLAGLNRAARRSAHRDA
jgi:hypothetical protein